MGGKMVMMLITHELDIAKDITDHVLFTNGGIIVEQGEPVQIFETPQNLHLQLFLASFFKGSKDDEVIEQVVAGEQ